MIEKLRARVAIEFETEAWLLLLVCVVLVVGGVLSIVAMVSS